ncbi:MAG TPA: sortase [Actinomycetota bacterium]|nr:sortase [Actinomycetota bacterium]
MRYVRFLGKLLISLGVGVLLFVVWTLWGTGLYTARAQDELEVTFADQPPVVLDEKGQVPENFTPGPGDPAFRLRIPAIDLRQVVVEGVGTDELHKGPGHYPSCRPGFARPLCTEFEEMWPGEDGRVIVSGHRTTYGAPFFHLDRLQAGDKIITTTTWGEYTYEVTRKEIVPPDSLAIAIQSGTPEIVLTTCNPKFSAAERLIVYAELVG